MRALRIRRARLAAGVIVLGLVTGVVVPWQLSSSGAQAPSPAWINSVTDAYDQQTGASLQLPPSFATANYSST